MPDFVYTLSPLEKQVFNDLSQRVDTTVFLGNRLQTILTFIENSITKVGVPVKVVAETETLNVDAVVKKKKVP